MYKRILVAVDQSQTSILAFNEAIKIAKSQGARLMIMNVLDEYIPDNRWISDEIKKYQNKARDASKKMLKKMITQANSKGISTETRLIEIKNIKERVSKKILAAAKKDSADLIVIGTHGRRGLRRFFIGSVAEEVIRS